MCVKTKAVNLIMGMELGKLFSVTSGKRRAYFKK